MTGVSPAPKGFVLTLVMGISAVTFLPLGIVFTILGLADTGDFPLAIGLGCLAVGAIDAGIALFMFGSGRARTRREEAARISQGTARVIKAKHNWNSRVGARHPLSLTVELAGAQPTRALLVPSHVDWQPGETISVSYAPDDPANFVPV
jgi:hypothetical protein